MRRVLGVATFAALASLLAGQAVQGDLPTFIHTAAPRYDAAAWAHGGERFPERRTPGVSNSGMAARRCHGFLCISGCGGLLRRQAFLVCEARYKAGSLANLAGGFERRSAAPSRDDSRRLHTAVLYARWPGRVHAGYDDGIGDGNLIGERENERADSRSRLVSHRRRASGWTNSVRVAR